jgi:hypothetical protein
MQAKFQAGCDFRQRLLGALAARQTVRNDADMVAALDLAIREIHDVTENAADRGADSMQDTERLIGRHGHPLAVFRVPHVAERALGNPRECTRSRSS